MTTIKKTSLAVALAAVFAGGTTPALATVVDVYNDVGTLVAPDVNEFDWNSGSTAVAIGKGPLGSDPLADPNPFTFLYQTNLVGFNDASGNPIGIPPLLSGLNVAFGSGGYEFTATTTIVETAAIIGPTSVSFTPSSGTFSIFYDDADAGGVKADNTTGAGFADGIQIARWSLTGGNSNFTLSTVVPPNGTGGANFAFSVIGILDFVNPAFITDGILGSKLNMSFTSSQNLPLTQPIPDEYFAGSAYDPPYTPYTPDTSCTGVAGSCDLFLKVDGSSTLTAAVPEPGTVMLLSLGLLGIGWNGTRRVGRTRG